jgi:hypothetical protein
MSFLHFASGQSKTGSLFRLSFFHLELFPTRDWGFWNTATIRAPGWLVQLLRDLDFHFLMGAIPKGDVDIAPQWISPLKQTSLNNTDSHNS